MMMGETEREFLAGEPANGWLELFSPAIMTWYTSKEGEPVISFLAQWI